MKWKPWWDHMHVKFTQLENALFFLVGMCNRQDKTLKKVVFDTVRIQILYVSEWRIESMKCRLCWVYHFLNVALPFTVASPCVGERVCACISVCQCVQMWACVCKCVCFVQSVWVFRWVWVCLWLSFVCLDGLRTDAGARHFKKPMSKTFSSVSDVCVVCRRSCRVMDKWSDREEKRAEGETEKHGWKKHWHYSFGKKTYFCQQPTAAGEFVFRLKKTENFCMR